MLHYPPISITTSSSKCNYYFRFTPSQSPDFLLIYQSPAFFPNLLMLAAAYPTAVHRSRHASLSLHRLSPFRFVPCISPSRCTGEQRFPSVVRLAAAVTARPTAQSSPDTLVRRPELRARRPSQCHPEPRDRRLTLDPRLARRWQWQASPVGRGARREGAEQELWSSKVREVEDD